MNFWRKNAAVAVIAAALGTLGTGCTTTITNLTPRELPRNANNLYPFEVAYDTSQQSVREQSVKPFVMIGTDLFPMTPTPMLKGRWEAQVPIPAATNHVYYRYKIDYQYNRIPSPGEGSRLSETYTLEIVDK
jgi:hypothetical protein